jgi:phage-related protein (TIGR01555 family)
MHIPEDEAERRRLNERGREILRRKNGAVRPHREDGYVNLLNKYGTKQDNSEAYKFEREPVIPDMQLTGLYEGNGLFSKIIDTPAEEALKHGFDLNLKSDELNAFVEDALDDLEWEERAATAIKWARLYGGALIVMLIDDGRGLEEPVDWEHIRSIDELRVYERSIVQPDYASLYQQDYGGKGVGNRVSKFGQPEYYYVSSIYGSFKVHESRCLVFRNGVLPEQTSNATYLFWGMPEYVRIRRALRETVTAHTDSVKLLERSVQAIYSMKGLASLLTTDDGENQVLKRLQLVDTSRGLLNSIAIDSEGEQYDFKTFQFSGVKDVIDATCNMLSALTNIPQTILFGRSPAGMNATGDSDFESYYNFVEKIQRLMLKRNLRTLLDVVFRAGIASGDVAEEPDYKLEFKPLWSLSDTEQATVDQTKAQTALVKAQTAQAYVDMQALDPTEVRRRLASDEEFDVEDIISEDDEDDLLHSLLGTEPDAMSDVEAAQRNLEQAQAPGGAEQTKLNADGGSGSGNFGHKGRPGEIGGSAPSDNVTQEMKEKRAVISLEKPTEENAQKAFADYSPLKIIEKYGDELYEAEDSGDKQKVELIRSKINSENLHEQSKCLKTLGTYIDDGYYVSASQSEDLMSDVYSRGTVNSKVGCFDLQPVQSGSTRDSVPSVYLSKDLIRISPEEMKARIAYQADKIGSDITLGGISHSDENAIKTYTYASAASAALRQGKEGDQSRKIKDILSRTASPSRTVYRGVTGEYARKLQSMDVGDTTKEKGFASTSMNREVAESFAKNGVIMKISVPSGYGKSLSIGYISLKPEEQEVLLNSNVTFRLVKKTGKELTFEALWKEKNQDNSFADTALDYENLDADTDYGVGVLVVQDGRFLCGTRQKEGSISGPGGHIEAGESPEDAAIRETQEEFGIKPKGLIPVAFLSDLKPPYCPSHVFLCTDFDGSIRCADGEMTSPGFITAEKVAELSTQNPERLFPPFAQSITALLDVLSSNPGLTSDAQNAKMKDRMDFNEADHPRDENGQFAEGEGSSSGSTESGPAVSPEGENVPCTGFASPARLEDHATRHGLAEMGFATKEEYQQKGIDFLKQPCGGDVIGYARPDGVVVRFNTKTTEYATGVPGGPLKTYMKAKCNRKTGEARPEVAMKYYEFNREKDLKEEDDEQGS